MMISAQTAFMELSNAVLSLTSLNYTLKMEMILLKPKPLVSRFACYRETLAPAHIERHTLRIRYTILSGNELMRKVMRYAMGLSER
jgi:hypothetical protein